jgi:hypothetical protein
MPVLSQDSILSILDEGSRAFVFPMLDNGYVYLAASRLALFRSPTDWAMTFEIFGYSPRGGIPDLDVTTFGSAVRSARTAADFVDEESYQAFLANNRYWQQQSFCPIGDEGWIDAENGEEIDPSATHLTLRGSEIGLPSREDYVRAGIAVADPAHIHVADTSRALAWTHRDEVLATNVERRVCLPEDMTQLLLLDDWPHPDVCDPEVLPSRSETFRQLADVLVSGDISRYRPGPGNTHWSNWPDGGTL